MAKRTKKTTKLPMLTLLRQEVKNLRERCNADMRVIENLNRSLQDMGIQLNEARRRTIPLGPNGEQGEVSFLPGYVESVDVSHDMRTQESISGFRTAVGVSARAVIYCIGNPVFYPPPTKKPAPEKGWQILNSYADKLAEPARNEFVANARAFEQGYTAGDITENTYRHYLATIAGNAVK